MAHGKPPDYKTAVSKDDRFITRRELRIDLEKHAKLTVDLVRDSMSELLQMLYMTGVLTPEKCQEAIAQAQAAQERMAANQEAVLGESAKSIAADMQRFDEQTADTKRALDLVQ